MGAPHFVQLIERSASCPDATEVEGGADELGVGIGGVSMGLP
jgi:hypothetical protein